MYIACRPSCPREREDNSTFCKIFYSESSQGTSGERFAFSNRIELYATYVATPPWQIVFSADAFSGIDIVKYFMTGNVSAALSEQSDPKSGTFYRNDNLGSLLRSQTVFKLQILNFEGSKVVKQLVFQDLNSDGESWFSEDQLIESSDWLIEESLDTSIHIRYDSAKLKTFLNPFEQLFVVVGSTKGEPCEESLWFTALSMTSSELTTNNCDWLKWWEHNDVISRGLADQLMFKPPAFLYSPGKYVSSGRNLKLGGKIQLLLRSA